MFCVVVKLDGLIGVGLGCSDSGFNGVFFIDTWALRQAGCETVGHLVTNASIDLITHLIFNK